MYLLHKSFKCAWAYTKLLVQGPDLKGHIDRVDVRVLVLIEFTGKGI